MYIQIVSTVKPDFGHRICTFSTRNKKIFQCPIVLSKSCSVNFFSAAEIFIFSLHLDCTYFNMQAYIGDI